MVGFRKDVNFITLFIYIYISTKLVYRLFTVLSNSVFHHCVKKGKNVKKGALIVECNCCMCKIAVCVLFI